VSNNMTALRIAGECQKLHKERARNYLCVSVIVGALY
jgi:hypothetical protein